MMAGYVLIGLFAAFGIFCSIWAVFGCLLPGGSGGAAVCRGSRGFPQRHFAVRCLFLMETGLIRPPLIVVDMGLEESDRQWLRRYGSRIKICTPEELSAGLELERNRFE